MFIIPNTKTEILTKFILRLNKIDKPFFLVVSQTLQIVQSCLEPYKKYR